MISSNRFVSVSSATLILLALPLASLIQPAHAAETTIGVCETQSNTARVYNQDGQLKMRLFDRVNKKTWMDGPATSTTNPEVVEYQNVAGEQTVKTGFSRNSPTSCYVMVGSKIESGRVTQGGVSNANTNTIGVCETQANTARVYDQDGQLKMRVFDRIKNVAWMDTPATRITNPEVVEYRNTAGEVIVRTTFSRNSPIDCSIIVGSRVEPGRVTQGGAANPNTPSQPVPTPTAQPR